MLFVWRNKMNLKACSSSILLFMWMQQKNYMLFTLYPRKAWKYLRHYSSVQSWQVLVIRSPNISFELVAAQSVSKLFLFLSSNILFVVQRKHCVIYAHTRIYIYTNTYTCFMYTPCTVTFCSYCEHSNKMPKGNDSHRWVWYADSSFNLFMPMMCHSNSQKAQITA